MDEQTNKPIKYLEAPKFSQSKTFIINEKRLMDYDFLLDIPDGEISIKRNVTIGNPRVTIEVTWRISKDSEKADK